ncbi:MAG: CDP-alcohol phosphatidyltransferase family protein [Bacteroidia bacterium]|nr:CDP-alcohol phosphatidyltransferase family protein [Bacteroidia bacterium]MDW8157801.1 CDP-alcohol phosphatidyltransferase family protein [Bacteroidia bacterium]
MPTLKKWLPNSITLLNLYFGCLAISFLASHQFRYATYCVFAASLCDFLDGFLARLLKVNSELGKQLDSLADIVSFGVVPGLTLFFLVEKNSFCFKTTETDFEFYLVSSSCLLIPIFSALRLAKFNLDTRQTTHFIGLPTPANTLFITCLPLIFEKQAPFRSFLEDYFLHPLSIITLTLLSSFLLVSPLPFYAIKFNSFKNFSLRENLPTFILITISLLCILTLSFLAAIPIFFFYIILSLIVLRKKSPRIIKN